MPMLFNTLFDTPFLGRGFRPFFFFGALFSVLSIGFWGAFYAGSGVMPPVFLIDPVAWHAHEMIYGFSMAIVAGFLLTAVANWTGGAPARHIHLAVLCALWLIGRVVMSLDLGLPLWSVIVLQNLFIPVLAISLAVPLLRSWNKRNFIFLGLLTILFASDIWFLSSGNLSALYVAMTMILMMISLVGGRVIPSFTMAALRWKGIHIVQKDQRKLEIAALLSLAAVALCLVFAKESIALTITAALSAIIHGLRLRHYHTLKILDNPLVWILHAGYAWLVLGLALLALTGMELFTTQNVLHALTAGCIGSMILGMICRVTLGHTGREISVGGWVISAFYMLQLATVIRVFGPIMMPEYTTEWIISSAFLWTYCFAVYLAVYGKMLFTKRADGLPA